MVSITDNNGSVISQQRYLPFGQVRANIGIIPQTDFGYTGQRNLDSGIGLMDYRARFYSSSLGRFIQPDTITPDMTQGLNRYSYVNNNPVNFNDPSGHARCDEDGSSIHFEDYDNDDWEMPENDPIDNGILIHPSHCNDEGACYSNGEKITAPFQWQDFAHDEWNPPLGFVDSVLAYEWTPLIADLIQLGTTIGVAIILSAGVATLSPGLAIVAVVLGFVSLTAMVFGMASLAYQADHELNGVRYRDLIKSAVINLSNPFGGFIPEVAFSQAPRLGEFVGDIFVPVVSVIDDLLP